MISGSTQHAHPPQKHLDLQIVLQNSFEATQMFCSDSAEPARLDHQKSLMPITKSFFWTSTSHQRGLTWRPHAHLPVWPRRSVTGSAPR